MIEYTQKDVERFWKKVDKSGGDDACWNWISPSTSRGYGCFRIKSRNVIAHRFAYFLCTNENISSDIVLRHQCNNPLCCNPHHMLKGTHVDNVADRVRDGRSATGERNGRAKLNEREVKEIRILSRSKTKSELSKIYSVSRKTIKNILDGKTWNTSGGSPT